MSDPKQAQPIEIMTLAQRIVELLNPYIPEVRRRVIEATLLILGDQPISEPPKALQLGAAPTELNLADFFNRNEDLKPSDYAQLCAAYHFAEFGVTPYSCDDLRDIAREAGVILPDRLDMTLTHATKNGKKLFQSAGKGLFKPTATGAAIFKERWQTTPGRKVKPERSKK